MRHTELASTGVRIHVEDFVDDGVEFHEPGIFSQVVFWLAQKCIFLTIATMNCDFSRPCESLHDINVIQEICNIPILGNPGMMNRGRIGYDRKSEGSGGTADDGSWLSKMSGEV
jgi:hypothetical protein